MATSSQHSEYHLFIIGDPGAGQAALMQGIARGFPQPPNDMDHISRYYGEECSVLVEGTSAELNISKWLFDPHAYENNRYADFADGIFILYDIDDEESFEDASDYWLKDVCGRHLFSELTSDGPPIFILGNNIRSDEPEKRQVSSERGQMLADEYGVKFMEISSTTGENVEKALQAVARDMISLQAHAVPAVPPKTKHS